MKIKEYEFFHGALGFFVSIRSVLGDSGGKQITLNEKYTTQMNLRQTIPLYLKCI